MAPMEKALWPQLNIPSKFIVSMEKAWFYEKFFFEVITIMVKDTKIQQNRNNVCQN